MYKHNLRENQDSKSPCESSKRPRMDKMLDENACSLAYMNKTNTDDEVEIPCNISESSADDRDTSTSITIYEDKTELPYFSKSSKNRTLQMINENLGMDNKPKRSPLATVSMNKAGCSYQQYAFPGTTARTPSKATDKIITDYYKKNQQRNSSKNYFNKLSDEIILQILQWLPKKSLMKCLILDTRFNRIVQDDTLWIRMDLGNKALKPGSVGKIFAKSFLILRLAQAKIASPIFEPSCDLQNFSTKLQYLDLSLASIEVGSLQQLLSVCRSLKKLSLEHVNVDLSVCQQIAQNRQLEALNLGMCNGLTTDGMKYICKYLKNLSSFNVSWTNIRIETVECIVSKLSPTVTRLNIAGCRNTCFDHNLSVLVERCPNLVELDVSDCTMLSTATIEIVSKLKKLEYLSLSRCYNITMTSYLALNQIDSLLYLDVFGLLSDAGLGMIEKTFKNIGINKFIHSSVARPTVTPRRTSIWGLRTRD